MSVADGVQHQALAAVEADAEIPVLPGHQVARYTIPGAGRLYYIERRGRCPELGPQVRIEVQRCPWDRNIVAVRRKMVIDAQYLQRAEVDQRVQPLDRVGVI